MALDVGVAYSENGKAVSGMGAEFRDLDNDGLPDIWHTARRIGNLPSVPQSRRRHLSLMLQAGAAGAANAGNVGLVQWRGGL